MGLRYKFGLGLICMAVLIWVASAEITQVCSAFFGFVKDLLLFLFGIDCFVNSV